MEERDLPAASSPGATTAERAAFARQPDSRGTTSATGQAPGSGSGSSEPDRTGNVANLARDAADQASSAAASIRDRVVNSAEQQQKAAADRVDSLADTLRHTAESMPDNQRWLADLTVRGGETLSDFADTLRRNDLQGLLRKADGFARNQPALFLGASMAAGFALARVAQVSASKVSGSRMDDRGGGSSRTEHGMDSRQDRQGDGPIPQPTARTTVTEGPGQLRNENGAGQRQGDSTEVSHG